LLVFDVGSVCVSFYKTQYYRTLPGKKINDQAYNKGELFSLESGSHLITMPSQSIIVKYFRSENYTNLSG